MQIDIRFQNGMEKTFYFELDDLTQMDKVVRNMRGKESFQISGNIKELQNLYSLLSKYREIKEHKININYKQVKLDWKWIEVEDVIDFVKSNIPPVELTVEILNSATFSLGGKHLISSHFEIESRKIILAGGINSSGNSKYREKRREKLIKDFFRELHAYYWHHTNLRIEHNVTRFAKRYFQMYCESQSR